MKSLEAKRPGFNNFLDSYQLVSWFLLRASLIIYKTVPVIFALQVFHYRAVRWCKEPHSVPGT